MEGSESRALGIGGYFLMTKASNTVVLSPGGGRLEWNTTAQALWTEFGGTKKKPMPNVTKKSVDMIESKKEYSIEAAYSGTPESLTANEVTSNSPTNVSESPTKTLSQRFGFQFTTPDSGLPAVNFPNPNEAGET